MMVTDWVRIALTSMFFCANFLCFSDWRFSAKKSIAIASVILVTCSLSIGLLSTYVPDFVHEQRWFLLVLQMGIVVGMGFLLGKHNGFRTMFSVTTAMVYSQIGAILTLSVAKVVTDKWLLMVMYAIIYAMLSVTAFVVVRKMLLKLMKETAIAWSSFFLLALFIYMTMLVIVPLPSADGATPLNSFAGLALSLSILWVFFLMRRTLKESEMRVFLEKKKQQVESQVSRLQEHLTLVEANEQKLAMLRHDLKQNLHILSQLIAGKDLKGCATVISALRESSEEIETSVAKRAICKNRFLNAVVSSYQDQFHRAGIEFSVEILLPDPDREIFVELAVLIGNCLDNALAGTQTAMDAVRTQTQNHEQPQAQSQTQMTLPVFPPVVLRCGPAGGQLFLEITNPFAGLVRFDKKTGAPIAQRSGHGIGTMSMRTFSEKHNASISWRAEEGIFRVRVLF